MWSWSSGSPRAPSRNGCHRPLQGYGPAGALRRAQHQAGGGSCGDTGGCCLPRARAGGSAGGSFGPWAPPWVTANTARPYPFCFLPPAAGKGERASPSNDGPSSHETFRAKAFQPTCKHASPSCPCASPSCPCTALQPPTVLPFPLAAGCRPLPALRMVTAARLDGLPGTGMP